MGANKISNRQKCGDILINIKTIKNKAKVFTFHCALCSTDCDQLKKFSQHLEKHLHYFEENHDEQVKLPILSFEPEEIKVEEQQDEELIDKGGSKAAIYEDPLETGKSYKSCFVSTEEVIPKNENKEIFGGDVTCNIISNTQVLNSSKNIYEVETRKDIIKPFPNKDISSDSFSEYSSDTDFQEEKEFSSVKLSKKKSHQNDVNKRPNCTLKRRRRVINETILPILLQEYKKYGQLWQVDNIAFGVKNKKYEIYAKIADELKLQTKKNISLEDINYHINYLNELYSKDKERDLKSKMENKEFVPDYEHYEEMSFLKDSQGPFLCTICNEILPKYDPYCQHTAQHNGTPPFKCPSCEMMFTNYHKYLIHKKRHLGIYNFHCDICGKGYLFKNDLEWHVTSHTGDKPYLCQICGTGFRARHGYDNHIRRHEKRFRYECHICKRGFNQLHALNNHVKSHLNIRDVICKICGKGFVHTKYLRRHELIHGTEKNYKCNECGKAFFQACGLRAHRKNHHC